MKAMILAAGFGTRLRPLTDYKPKALMPIVNRPVIARCIDYLKLHGIECIAVNAHYQSQQLVDYLTNEDSFEVDIDVRIESELLGSGGGIKNFADFFNKDTFIVINGDVVTDIDLSKAIAHHKESGQIATLVLIDYTHLNNVLISESGKVLDFSPIRTDGRLAFASIHLMEPEILSFIPESGRTNIVNDVYRNMINSGITINSFISNEHIWYDIGNPESYIKANIEILKLNDCPIVIGRDSAVDPSVKYKDWAIVGKSADIERGVEIERSILWDNVKVKQGIRIIDSIVTSNKRIERDLVNEIY